MVKLENQRNSEKNAEAHRKSMVNKVSAEDTSASSRVSDCDKDMEDTVSKLKTTRFMVENGDILVDAICWF